MAKDNPLDQIVDYATDKLVAEVSDVPDDSPPFASQKLTREEQLERYAEMREKPDAWLKLLDERGLRETVEYAARMEAALRNRPPEEAG